MAPNPKVMQAVKELGYRVTVGDVAAKAGLDVNFAQRELLTLASEAGGHIQVAESGDIAYLFPQNFSDVLRNKFLRLQLQEWWQKIWRVLFYLIRISFGLVLVASLLLIFVAIAILLSSSSDNNDGGGGGGGDRGGGFFFFPYFGNDLIWLFYWNHDESYYQRRSRSTGQKPEMNFLEAVFSFLFGDGNPNYNLEDRKWSSIAATIRNNKGAIAAEQIAPYLDNLGQGYAIEYEEYMLPALARFDGRPEVSPEGQIVYHFPQLQTTATERNSEPVAAYLREMLWRFSHASSGQIMLAAGLGAVNLVGALFLGSLLTKSAIGSGLLSLVATIYPMLLIYGVGFLTIPLVRYFWIKWKNSSIEARNQERQQRMMLLNEPDANLLQKLAYAREFAAENVLTGEDLAYTTETELTAQELEQSAKIDAEWQKRIGRSDNL
ncbi:MAG: hypothetical protein QQW96_05125 [Tychonema bourrellyi B0820]|uniref:Uncharacterized protein n=1 Tax=Tychonema bourrellyi FEM_GT703 TaxID=2040638 RepID=A0A2G4F0K1_9CYAN|nr:hypothetical protein [Tychonema bourrellyi]MDQ2097013.1 hypothetical protein [Tychonema bourrellyi B0820]PHX55289.1 hypothetical protein CP500_011625 [Tychonema bourrellyi FEM_GT703]